MSSPLLTGSVPFAQRIAAVLVWLVGIAITASLLVFGFFVGAALLGVAAIVALVAMIRLRLGKPIIPRRSAPAGSAPPRTGATIVDAEYVVIRRDSR